MKGFRQASKKVFRISPIEKIGNRAVEGFPAGLEKSLSKLSDRKTGSQAGVVEHSLTGLEKVFRVCTNRETGTAPLKAFRQAKKIFRVCTKRKNRNRAVGGFPAGQLLRGSASSFVLRRGGCSPPRPAPARHTPHLQEPPVTFTADQLEALAGVTFTSAETTRADAILTLCVTAAEGILGRPLGEDVPPGVAAAVLSASLRQFQNPGGVQQESIGGISTAYPSAGRLFTGEELVMIRQARGNTVTSIRVTTDATTTE